MVSFHVLEHLPDPIEVLTEIKLKVKSGGLVIIEVPHARDLLLTLGNKEYKNFTLWSQHLILHTRDSLRKLLRYTGFTDVEIEGVQRYPLSNHLNWLANGKPGGHKSPLSIIDSDELSKAYCNSLSKLDQTDTLVAVARVP
jgi:2-polyprenyl-3-methyl-5-hydroxy-6-metoxy-1,4-benzoquinol methylase